MDYVVDKNINICTVTETWLEHEDEVIRAELNAIGYAFKDVPRVDRQGGGIGLLHRSNLVSNLLKSGETTSFEFAVWKIALQCSTWLFHVIYRAPYSQAHPVTSDLFFQQFSDYLELNKHWIHKFSYNWRFQHTCQQKR